MTEEKVPNLQEQIRTVNQILDKSPFIAYVTSVVGIISFGLAAHFGAPGELVWLAGFTIAFSCTGFGGFWAINAKREYNKLVEQLNSKS